MEKDTILAIILGILAVLALGFVFFVNAGDSFSFLADPLSGDGFGTLCSSAQDCDDFCNNNFGQCSEYCQSNPENPLCDTVMDGR